MTRYSQPVMNAPYTVWYGGGRPLMAYRITISIFLYQQVKKKSEPFVARESQSNAAGPLGWHTVHLTQISAGGAPNLTWNLNQDGRIQHDPWEGHSCVGTLRGEHAGAGDHGRPGESRLSSAGGGIEDSRVCFDLRNLPSVTAAHGHDLMWRNVRRISGSAVWNSQVMMRW